jgi:hypothetical protein
MRDYQNEVLKAISENDLINYLCGYGDYYISYSQFIPCYMHTDITAVLRDGIYKAYETTKTVKDEFEKALYGLLKMGAFQTYVAASYVNLQLYYEKKGLNPFTIDRDNIKQALREAINRDKKEIMKGVTDFHGYTYPEAWNDIERWEYIN